MMRQLLMEKKMGKAKDVDLLTSTDERIVLEAYQTVDVDAGWSELAALYDAEYLAKISAGKEKTSASGKVLADVLLKAVETGEAPSVDARAVLLMVDAPEIPARWMISKFGLAETVRAILAASELGRNRVKYDEATGEYVKKQIYFFPVEDAAALVSLASSGVQATTVRELVPSVLEIRAASASAADDDYEAAVQLIRDEWPRLKDTARFLAALAFPETGWWRELDTMPMEYCAWLMSAADSSAAAVDLAKKAYPFISTDHLDATLMGLGLDVVPVLDAVRKMGLEAQVWMPILEHVESLAAFTLHAVMGGEALPYLHVLQRRPSLAALALAPIAASSRSPYRDSARFFLAQVAASAGDSILDVAPKLNAGAAGVLHELLSPQHAGPSELPEFLASPPWKRKRKAQKTKVIELDLIFDPPICHMSAEEQEATKHKHRHTKNTGEEIAAELMEVLKQEGGSRNVSSLYRLRDWELAKPVLDQIIEADLECHCCLFTTDITRVIAHWGENAAEFILRFGEHRHLFAAAMYLEDARFAMTVAEDFVNVKSLFEDARSWLDNYPKAATLGLVPAALGKRKKARREAIKALRHIAKNNHSTLIEAAARYGEAALEAVKAILAVDPYELLPKKVPAPPSWFDPRAIPRLIVASSGHSLGDEAMNVAVTSLALSKPEDVYAGVDGLKDLCTPDSLERFALAVFQTWLAFGASNKEYWALYGPGWLGSDASVRVLAPLIRRWPSESASKRATLGLDVLAMIGTELAMMHIYEISQRVKYASIKERAGVLVDELAAELGLDSEQLGDRLVPTLDLSDDGTTTIDYGSRSFLVRLDENLKPVVFSDAGKRLKSLPKPGKKDSETAASEQKRFKGLTKDLKTVATQQIDRLERSMVQRRRWSAAEFQKLFVVHPLITNLTRRLVWGEYEGLDLRRTFRVDAEGQLVDADDNVVDLGEGVVGIAHPLELGAMNQAWGTVFADFEIVQPFEQLSREFWLAQTTRLDTVLGVSESAPKIVYGFENYGWRRGDPEGWIEYHERDFADIRARVEYSGTVGRGPLNDSESLRIKSLRFLRGSDTIELSAVDPVFFSEVYRDLQRVLT